MECTSISLLIPKCGSASPKANLSLSPSPHSPMEGLLALGCIGASLVGFVIALVAYYASRNVCLPGIGRNFDSESSSFEKISYCITIITHCSACLSLIEEKNSVL